MVFSYIFFIRMTASSLNNQATLSHLSSFRYLLEEIENYYKKICICI